MSAQAEPADGDIVHVKGVVRVSKLNGFKPVVDFHLDACLPLSECDIIAIEKPVFKLGDRIIAEGHHGEVIGIHFQPGAGELLWIAPDAGNQRAWTVASSKCEREPAPPPSAEILRFNGLPTEAERPSDSEDTAA